MNEALGPRAEQLNSVGNLGSAEAVKRAVASGLGASFVLARTVRSELASGELAISRLKGKPLTKTFYLALLKDRAAATPAARMFDFLLTRQA